MKEYEYILTYNGISQTLTKNPMGWNNVGIQFEFNWTYMSRLRNLSFTLRFPRKAKLNDITGYSFIEDAYNTEGISAKIDITINKRNPSNNRYEYFYSGILDLLPNRFQKTHKYIEVPIIDSQKLHRFISRDEIEINLFNDKSIDDITLSSITKQTISLPPIDVIIEALATCTENDNHTWSDFGLEEFYFTNPVYSIKGLESVDLNNTDTIYTNQREYAVDVKISLNADYNIQGTLSYTGSGTFHVSYIYKSYNYLGTQIDSGSLYYFEKTIDSGLSPMVLNEIGNIDNSITLEIPSNGYIKLFCQMWFSGSLVDPGPDANITRIETSIVNILEYNAGYETTDSYCLFPHEAFSRAIQILTSETDTSKLFYSELFGRTDSQYQTYYENGQYCYDAIASGRMIRQYPDAALNITFKDLFNSFKALYNIGLGFDNANDRFYIDNLASFFDANYFMFDLGEVANLVITPLDEGYFNKIMAGFENEGDYETFQGANEFNVNREYSTSAPVKNEKELRSKCRLDSVGIEETRKYQFVENSSLDTKCDNDVFIIRTDGSIPVLDATVTGFAGIEKYYNTMLSPRQNLIRHANILAACHYKNNNPIKLQKSDKQFDMVVNGIDENSDIPISELGEPLFIPEMYEFDSYTNSSIINIMLNNPNGYVKFTNFGDSFEGYILKLETGDYNKKAKYALIAKVPVSVKNYIFEDSVGKDFEDGKTFIF